MALRPTLSSGLPFSDLPCDVHQICQQCFIQANGYTKRHIGESQLDENTMEKQKGREEKELIPVQLDESYSAKTFV